ncbi:hypothetical protein B0H34DRAFT_671758 [Crassisporium funariophilum]|nr:hypothetical protein B0H34DRAFT_671758 [Crassisporium funariophilum]
MFNHLICFIALAVILLPLAKGSHLYMTGNTPSTYFSGMRNHQEGYRKTDKYIKTYRFRAGGSNTSICRLLHEQKIKTYRSHGKWWIPLSADAILEVPVTRRGRHWLGEITGPASVFVNMCIGTEDFITHAPKFICPDPLRNAAKAIIIWKEGDRISKTPSVWHVWHQTSQTQPVFHIVSGDILTLAMP